MTPQNNPENNLIWPRGAICQRFSRRAFLKMAGLTALSAAAAGCAPARSNLAAATPTFGKSDVEVKLSAQEIDWELAPGKVIKAWTYNGVVPG
ncbi:MAG: hypothetical protein DPW09_44570, partial [Anaerolineae bacterium]|nr:hypothetical protein [Anaerolineae bacterium]